ncbi:MAG TPA: GNAT family N-acetyltransferase [Candidatus Bathyarchaeia archaeon]|nr:GNAT family N-acetyltransferase [Candidatus Bathyarchaeia archaeon]
MKMSVKEITEENWIDAIKLKVKKEQEGFVASNAISLAQSKFHPFLECYGIFADEKMIGFSALGINPEDNKLWIARHMIDENSQGQGYGKKGLKAVIEFMNEKFKPKEILLDVEENNEIATKLYVKAGFKPTGEKHGNSPIYKLDMSNYSADY